MLVWGTIVVAPWMEELAFRGFLLSGVSAKIGFWPAAVASSLVWAAAHGVSGVLLPFTFTGILLCWIRRRTGSTRTGIALHAASNTLAALGVVSGALLLPPVLAVALGLAATKSDGTRRIGRLASRSMDALSGAADLTTRAAAKRIAAPARAWTWAGCAIGIGVCLRVAGGHLDLLGGVLYPLGEILAALGAAALGYALLGARKQFDTPSTTCLAGVLGAGIVTTSLLASPSGGELASLVPAGLTLASFGLVGLRFGTMPRRARAAGVAAGLLVALTLDPMPYLVATSHAFDIQTTGTLLVAAILLATVGRTVRRHQVPQGADLSTPPDENFEYEYPPVVVVRGSSVPTTSAREP